MPLITTPEELDPNEQKVLEIIRANRNISHGELLNKIVKEICCSMAEAEAMVRRLESKGYIHRSGGVWNLK